MIYPCLTHSNHVFKETRFIGFHPKYGLQDSTLCLFCSLVIKTRYTPGRNFVHVEMFMENTYIDYTLIPVSIQSCLTVVS